MSQPPLPPNRTNSPVAPSNSRFSAGFQPVRSRHLRRKRELLLASNQSKQPSQPNPPVSSIPHPSVPSQSQIPALTPHAQKWLPQPSPTSFNHPNPVTNPLTTNKNPTRITPTSPSPIKSFPVNPNTGLHHPNTAPPIHRAVQPSAHGITPDHASASGNPPHVSQTRISHPNPPTEGAAQNHLISADKPSVWGKIISTEIPAGSVKTNAMQRNVSNSTQGLLTTSRFSNIQPNSVTGKRTSAIHNSQAYSTNNSQRNPTDQSADHRKEYTNASAQHTRAEKRQRTDFQQSVLDSFQSESPRISPLSLGPSYTAPHHPITRSSQPSKPSLLEYSDLDDPNAGVVPTASRIALDPRAFTSGESQHTLKETQPRSEPGTSGIQMPSSDLAQPDLDMCKAGCYEKGIHFLHPAIAQDISPFACREYYFNSLMFNHHGHPIVTPVQKPIVHQGQPPPEATPLPESTMVEEMQVDVPSNAEASEQRGNVPMSAKMKEHPPDARITSSLGDKSKENAKLNRSTSVEGEHSLKQKKSMNVDLNPAKTNEQNDNEFVSQLASEKGSGKAPQAAPTTEHIVDEDGDSRMKESSAARTHDKNQSIPRNIDSYSSDKKQNTDDAPMREKTSANAQKTPQDAINEDLSKQDTSNQEKPDINAQSLQPDTRSKEAKNQGEGRSVDIGDNMSQIQALQQSLQAFIERSSHSNPSGRFALPAMNLMGMSISRFTAREQAIYLAGWAGGVISMTGGQPPNGTSSDRVAPFSMQHVLQYEGQNGDANKAPIHEHQSKHAVQSKSQTEPNAKKPSASAIVLNMRSMPSREVAPIANTDALARGTTQASVQHDASTLPAVGTARPAKRDQRAEANRHNERRASPNADLSSTEGMKPDSMINRTSNHNTTPGPKKVIAKSKVVDTTRGTIGKAEALKKISPNRSSSVGLVSNGTERKEATHEQARSLGKAVHSARTGEDAYAARARLTEMMRAKTGDEAHANRAKLSQKADRDRSTPENQNNRNSSTTAIVLRPQTGEEAYAARARMTEMMRHAQTGEDAYAARARMTEMMRGQPTGPTARRNLEKTPRIARAISSVKDAGEGSSGQYSERKRQDRKDQHKAPSLSPIVINLDDDDMPQQPQQIHDSESPVTNERRRPRSPTSRKRSFAQYENPTLVNEVELRQGNSNAGSRLNRPESTRHSATTRELRPNIGTGTYSPSVEVIEIPPDDPKEEDHQIMLTRYGMVAIVRDEKTRNIRWMACRFCPVYGCRTKEKNYIQFYQAPFSESEILRHLKEEHNEWPEYDRAPPDIKRKMFVGKTLPPRETFLMRIEEIAKADTKLKREQRHVGRP